jgi:hypothetical protein
MPSNLSGNSPGEMLKLRFDGPNKPPQIDFEIPPLMALAQIGRVSGELVKAYYEAVGDRRKYFRISQLLPFASVKLIPQ